MGPRLLKLVVLGGIFFVTAGPAWAAVVNCWGLAFATSPTDHTDVKTVHAQCPYGWKVTGGGADIDGGEPEAVLRATRPSSMSTWAGSGHEVDPSPTAWNVEARAVCATLPHSALYEVRTATTSTEVLPGAKFVQALCPAGKKAIGGGAAINGATQNVLLRTIRPIAGSPPSGWESLATTADGSATPWTLTTYAVCVANAIFPDLTIATATSATDTASPKTLTVTCPPGKRPLGGGADVGGGSPNQAAGEWEEALVTTAPTFDLTRRWIASAQTEDAHATPWNLVAYVVCATAPY